MSCVSICSVNLLINKYLSQRGVVGEKWLLVVVGGVAQQTRLQRALLLPRQHLLQLRLNRRTRLNKITQNSKGISHGSISRMANEHGI